MRVVSPDIFYDYFITNENFNNDFSLKAKNSYLDEDGYLKEKFDFKIFNQTGEWLENQINSMNTDSDESETTYGNFKYVSTVVDEQAMFPEYSQVFSFQLIAPEKHRTKLVEFFDDFATGINNLEKELSLINENNKEEKYDLLIQLGELTTPEYDNKEDIGGMERFIISMTIVVTLTTSIITNKKIKLTHITSDDTEDVIKYNQLTIERQNELVPDNKASNEIVYDVNKSDLVISISALYTGSPFSLKVMKYTFLEDNVEMSIPLHYQDTSTEIVDYIEDSPIYDIDARYDMYIAGAHVEYQFGQPVSFSVTLKKKAVPSLGQ